MKSDRLLICRPQGGLNDMLCQIERACRYAEAFDRTVLVETDFRNARNFRDRFSRYFVSRQDRLVFKTDHLSAYGDLRDVFPAIAAGRLDDYRARVDNKTFRFVEEETGQPLSFDFTRDYRERTLLHHDSGGGGFAIGALTRMRLHDNITDLLLHRAKLIGPRYSAVHVRATDVRSRFEGPVQDLAKQLNGRVFVATDNRNCLEQCKEAFGADRVISFAKLPAVAGQPLHHADAVVDVYEANRDALIDLVLLALSSNCYAFELEANVHNMKYSGFSVLAINLQSAKPILSQLISRPDADLQRTLWPLAY